MTYPYLLPQPSAHLCLILAALVETCVTLQDRLNLSEVPRCVARCDSCKKKWCQQTRTATLCRMLRLARWIYMNYITSNAHLYSSWDGEITFARFNISANTIFGHWFCRPMPARQSKVTTRGLEDSIDTKRNGSDLCKVEDAAWVGTPAQSHFTSTL